MEFDNTNLHDIAYHFCVSHLSGALIPATRLSKILKSIFHGEQPSALSLRYLKELNLNELQQLATGQITYQAYIAALDPALVAREQAAKAHKQALEQERLAQEAQWQRKIQLQRDAAKTAHKAREAERKKAA